MKNQLVDYQHHGRWNENKIEAIAKSVDCATKAKHEYNNY